MSSAEIDAMIAQVRSHNIVKMSVKNNDSGQSLKKLCVETFEKIDRDVEKVKQEIAMTKKRQEQLDDEITELEEQIEVKKFDETLNSTLTEECEKVMLKVRNI